MEATDSRQSNDCGRRCPPFAEPHTKDRTSAPCTRRRRADRTCMYRSGREGIRGRGRRTRDCRGPRVRRSGRRRPRRSSAGEEGFELVADDLAKERLFGLVTFVPVDGWEPSGAGRKRRDERSRGRDIAGLRASRVSTCTPAECPAHGRWLSTGYFDLIGTHKYWLRLCLFARQLQRPSYMLPPKSSATAMAAPASDLRSCRSLWVKVVPSEAPCSSSSRASSTSSRSRAQLMGRRP